MRKEVLLAGGTGFLGSNLLRAMLSQDIPVVLLKRSFSRLDRIQDLLPRVTCYDIDRQPLDQIFAKHSIGTIINCATDYGKKSVEPFQVIDANLIFPLTLLHAGKNHGISAFINTDTILDKRVSHYSLSKKQFLDWFRMHSSDLTCVNVSVEHFYGPGDDKTKFVSSMIALLLAKVPHIDLTPGDQKRDFIHIDDVVSAFIKILEHLNTLGHGFHQYEVGTGRPLEIRQVMLYLQKMTRASATELRFGALPYRENEVMESRVDLRALEKLAWSAKTALFEGLAETVKIEEQRAIR